jgi:hypothetical protein
MIADKHIFAVANAVFTRKNKGLIQNYRQRHGRQPDIANPRRYTELMLWRMIVDRNPQFVVFSDKIACKEYVKRRCPDLLVPRTLWTGRDANAIPDEILRGDVYVKANHGCNYNQRIRGGHFDRAVLKQQTDGWLGSVYGQESGQWAYSRVEPRLFVEEAVGDVEEGMVEFNVRVGNGRAILGSMILGCKTPGQQVGYFDTDGRPTQGMTDPEGSPVVEMSVSPSVMEPYRGAVRFAEQLSVGVDYVRCDFMWNGKELFGGEITVYPAAGLHEPANTRVRTVTLNGWDLRQSHFLKSPQKGWARIYAGALKRQLTASRGPQ